MREGGVSITILKEGSVYDSFEFLAQHMIEKQKHIDKQAELRRQLHEANVRIPKLQDRVLLRIGERMVSVGSRLKERYAMTSSNM